MGRRQVPGRRGTGLALLPAEEWMPRGVCAPGHEPRHAPGVWFPKDGVGVDYAKRLCSTCPVQVECLEYALEHRIDAGVWGGESERARRRLLKEQGVDLADGYGVAAADAVDA